MLGSFARNAAVALLGLSATLTASPAVDQPAAVPGHLHHHGNHAGSAWGGYDIQRGGTTVTASWVNPQVSCSGRGVNSVWAGFDGAGNSTVEQIGIDFDCSSGSIRYNPWYEMYPRGSVYFSENTRAGDSMTATVVHDQGPNYTMTLSDTTQNWSRTFHDSLSSAQDATSEAIMERLSDNVDNFGSVTFTGCKLDGKEFGSYSTRRDVVSNNGITQVDTGSLSGDRFTMTWRHS